jgi:tRNA uridine 5-carboxymethylaminomethyl modification enzyme
MKRDFDIVVVGGGHAGAEAAWASARMGCQAALVTMSIEAIARMSCNPAIGGLGKGQIVREIDALGGLMGLAADRGGIQFRILNRSKGPAVRAPRAQADQRLYSQAVRELLQATDGLEIIEGTVESIIVEKAAACGPAKQTSGAQSQIRGIRLQDGRELSCRAIVVTTGTFLNGLMHCGEQKTVGGRVNESASTGLSHSLSELGLQMARLKTGTPPRVLKKSVDLDRLAVQAGDDPPVPFSFMNDSIKQEQIVCWITHTNETTHKIIRDNLDRAPMYSGQIQSSGPRYCPSIETKVVRFADKPSHQLFLEPEGIDHPWIYCNGISTSLPRDVQESLVHSIVGLEKAEIAQFGYAIEYDWVPTEQIGATLETKRVSGLYLAGQINGTSGYEEAAAQGLMAGINAVLKLRDEEPLVLGRDEAYIGVMIDDIVTRPPDEPYRMFTSRAEYRLHLRSDNADIRLTPIGRRVGLVDDRRWSVFEQKREAIESLEAMLIARRFEGRSCADWLRRPEVELEELARRVGDLDLDRLPAVVRQVVQINIKYGGYLEREKRDIERFRQQEARRIPEMFDYATVKDLRREAREKFDLLRPRSLGQAARISGISPADIATLSIYLMRHRK